MLLILDEIATGFGLTGGSLPMSAAAACSAIDVYKRDNVLGNAGMLAKMLQIFENYLIENLVS